MIDLLGKLEELQEKMLDTSVELDYYGGLSDEFRNHSSELRNASFIVEDWIEQVKLKRMME